MKKSVVIGCLAGLLGISQSVVAEVEKENDSIEFAEEDDDDFAIEGEGELFEESSDVDNNSRIADEEYQKLIGFKPNRVLGLRTVSHIGPNEGKGRGMIEAIAKYYEKNSRGLVDIRYQKSGGRTVFKVYPSSKHNVGTHLSSYSHATAIHEAGHVIFNLGHSKAIWRFTEGRFKGKQAMDRNTVMNSLSKYSEYLVAPQYWKLGWLPESEIVMYDEAVKKISLKRISDFNKKAQSCMIIPFKQWNKEGQNGAPLFVSVSQSGKVLMHLYYGGGTRLHKELRGPNKYTFQEGLEFEVSAEKDGLTEINIIPSFTK